jgi:hypothetical protein
MSSGDLPFVSGRMRKTKATAMAQTLAYWGRFDETVSAEVYG